MRIKAVKIRNVKRFESLDIEGLKPEVKLVVLTGPNGSGKSSLFDAFRLWLYFNGNSGHFSADPTYHLRKVGDNVMWPDLVKIDFYDGALEGDQRKMYFYFRTAFRNSSDFRNENVARAGDIFQQPIRGKMNEDDRCVADNYKRLVALTIANIFDGDNAGVLVSDLIEKLVGKVRGAMRRVFDDLILTGPGDPLSDGTFFFEKGTSKKIYYKNLSGGEKSAFDLLLDFVVKKEFYKNTVYCIDEPETHLHTKLQAKLLEELFCQLPENSQLWISTHSIGMMRKAMELQKAYPDTVAFLDFHGRDFDQHVHLKPTIMSRQQWVKNLEVALDDLARLVAPEIVVLCEGKPLSGGKITANTEFDAFCYRKIFADEFPNADFVSVGNQHDVQSDRFEIGKAIQTLTSRTKVIRLIDRDDRAPAEITDLQSRGVRVLGRRSLESYLLDDELLGKLCSSVQKAEKTKELIDAKASAMDEIVKQGKPSDDIKSATGLIYNSAKKLLGLSQAGADGLAFLKFTMLPLFTSETESYQQLKQDVFGV